MIIKSILCPLSKSIAFINLNVHNKSLVAKLDKFANINVMTCVATLHNFTCAIKPLYKDLHTSYKVKLWNQSKTSQYVHLQRSLVGQKGNLRETVAFFLIQDKWAFRVTKIITLGKEKLVVKQKVYFLWEKYETEKFHNLS